MYDVAIVGAGPVGAIAANLCGVYGLTAVAFDRADDVYDLPRAAGLHDDAQRILANAGLLEAVLPNTASFAGAEFVDADRNRLIGIEIPPDLLTPNGYPVVLNIHQPGLERAIRSQLQRFTGVELRTGSEVVDFEQGAEGVTLTVRDCHADTQSQVQARWVIAADGASSPVRKACGIAWDSLGYDCEWLVVDAEMTADLQLTEFAQQICDPHRPTTLLPLPGRLRRWEFQLRRGETREEMEEVSRVWELLKPWMTPADGEIVRAVVYRFHATIAAKFRHQHVFLAGDAAHQTPPFAGQGLCTGIRDVENLVWKLAAVRGQKAGDRLLDTYTAERHPLAVAMVEHSTNTGRLIDAFADMARGGPEPSPELQEYAYGGNQQLPDMAEGLLASERDAWVGRLVANESVQDGDVIGRFDDVVGHRWALLSLGGERSSLSRNWREFLEQQDVVWVIAHASAPTLAALLRTSEAILVRPDRVIFGSPRSSEPPKLA